MPFGASTIELKVHTATNSLALSLPSPKPIPRRDREAGVRYTTHLKCVCSPAQMLHAVRESNILVPSRRMMCRGKNVLLFFMEILLFNLIWLILVLKPWKW